MVSRKEAGLRNKKGAWNKVEWRRMFRPYSLDGIVQQKSVNE